MEIKECKSSDFIIKEVEVVLNKILDEIKNTCPLDKLEVTSVYWDTIKNISKVNTCKQTIFGITIAENIYYEHLVCVSFKDRELKVEIKDPNEYLNFLLKEKFTEFATNNKNSIKSVCFITDF